VYETFYGFSGKPFQLNPDPAFFFGSRGHKRAFAYLQYGLYQSEGFIVITGEVGAGKTTIVRNLFEHMDRDRMVAAQLVSTQLDADDMLRSVAVAFGLPIHAVDKASLLASLEAFLCQVAVDGKRALLVVDEAQNLTPRAIEELRMLSNFQLGDQALLQSFLVGQPELRQMMQAPEMQQLRQRVIASYHLGPLDRNETAAYIEHRLTHVGWRGDPGFNAAAIDVIHSVSGGIPRRINTVCNRLLLAGYLAEKHAFGAADVEAIAREIRDEMGADAALASAPEQTNMRSGLASCPDPSSSAVPAIPAVPAVNGSTAGLPVVPGDAELWLVRFNSIDERIDRLEKSVGRAIGLLQRLLHPERMGKPGTPMGRG
jgi:putative secretion ATPase (PEP-CTERM system associated)